MSTYFNCNHWHCEVGDESFVVTEVWSGGSISCWNDVDPDECVDVVEIW
jgi:hypothetical protein